MSIDVLVLEDRKFTRQVIGGYLSANLARDASEALDPNPDAMGGQLSPMLPDGWEPLRRGDFKVYCPEDEEIEALIEVAGSEDRIGLRDQVSAISVEAFVRPHPDVLVVDLALSEYEQTELMAKDRWPAMSCQDCCPPKPDSAMDPRDLVDEMTGFKIIRAHAGILPVIATSYASHPLVSYGCHTNGARAFVRKPVREKETREGQEGWDWETAAGIADLEQAGFDATDPLAAVVLNYLTTLSAQILAVLPLLALQRLGDCTDEQLQGSTLASK